MRPRKTLEERVMEKVGVSRMMTPWGISALLRAELDRLARQVKKLIALGVERKRGKDGAVVRREVLELIEQAKQ